MLVHTEPHFVPGDKISHGLREIYRYRSTKSLSLKGGVSTRMDFASGFSHRKQARSLIGQIEHGSHQVVRNVLDQKHPRIAWQIG